MDIKVILDDEIKEVLDKIISSVLPHENYNEESALTTIKELGKVIKLDELSDVYYVILKILFNISKVNIKKFNYGLRLSRDVLDSSLTVGIEDLIIDKNTNMVEFLKTRGFDGDLEIETNFDNAVDLLYTLTLEKYDELMEMKIDSNDAVGYLLALKESMIINLSKQSVNMQVEILNEGLRIGRDTFVGYKDYLKFMRIIEGSIHSRFVDFLSSKKDKASFDSLDSANDFEDDETVEVKPLFKTGYQPLDDALSVMTGDVVTIVGDEGVGKTTLLVEQVYRAMMEGHSVLMMTGESAIQKIWSSIVGKHLYELTGLRVEWREIQNILELPDEVRTKVNMAKLDLIENYKIGKFHAQRYFYYETFYDDVEEYILKYPDIGLICVDHADRLKSTGELSINGYLRTQKERVDSLYQQCIDISDEYPLAVMILAHSNTEANKATLKGKDVGVRIGASSSATSKDSDMVIYLRKTDELRRQSMILVEVKKVREFADNIRPFILKRENGISAFTYDEDFQTSDVDEEELTDVF